jgi:hypothetical protein
MLLHSPAYHPERNGAAEGAVQTIKGSLRKLTCQYDEIRDSHFKIALFQSVCQYRFTPTSITQFTPAEVIFKYAPYTKLSMLLPGDKVTRWMPIEPSRKNVEIGECIFVKNNKAGVKWLPGIIRKKFGSVRYLVQLGTSERVVHTNQLRRIPKSSNRYRENGMGTSTSPPFTKQS